MKHYHITINSDHLFRGRRTGKANEIARLIYGAKFFDNQKCLDALIKLCCHDIDASKFDTIVPVQTRDSKFGLPQRLAYAIADKLKLNCIRALSNQNTEASNSLMGKKVLIIDDVIYTGATMHKAITACEKANAAYIQFFAIAHSRRFVFDATTGSLHSVNFLPKVQPMKSSKKTVSKKTKAVKKSLKLFKYKATLNHDNGRFSIVLSAKDKDSAIKQICNAEKCPKSAIFRIIQLKS